MAKTRKLGLIAFDIVRGLILGVAICYGLLALSQTNANDIIFRYVGY